MSKIKGLIISGFPGVGKTAAERKCREAVDCESTAFHFPVDWKAVAEDKKQVRQENPNWVSDYVDHIEKLASEVGYLYVFVSSHKLVREEMDKRGIPYIVVIPHKHLRDEYMMRYVKRGDSAEFIANIYSHWDEWLDEIDENAPAVIRLNRGEYLADFIPV